MPRPTSSGRRRIAARLHATPSAPPANAISVASPVRSSADSIDHSQRYTRFRPGRVKIATGYNDDAMIFDSLILAAVTDELTRTLAGGKVERVAQPSPLELVIGLYAHGAKHSLLLSADPWRRAST